MFSRFFIKRKDIFELIKANKIMEIQKMYHEDMMYEHNNKGQSAITYAVILERKEIVEFLVNKGCKLPREINGIGTLHYLIDKKSKNYDLVSFIISTGFGVNSFSQGVSPISRCLQHKKTDFKMVLLLLEHHADINRATTYTLTPLCIVINNNEKTVEEKLELLYLFERKQLIFQSEDIQTREIVRKNLYLQCLQKRQYSIFIQLVRLYKNITGEELDSIKQYLVPGVMDSLHQQELIKISEQYDLKIYFPANFYTYTSLVKQLQVRSIDELHTDGFIIHICQHNGLTLIEKKELILLYLRRGGTLETNKQIKDYQFTLVGYLACFYYRVDECYELVKFLLCKGAPLESIYSSALFEVLWFGQTQYVTLFLKNNANVFHTCQDGRTIFSNLGLVTPINTSVSTMKMFELQKLVFQSVKNIDEKRRLMFRSYITKHTSGETLITNPVHYFLCMSRCKHKEDVVAYYLDNGFSISEQIEDEFLDFDIVRDIMRCQDRKFIIKMLENNPSMTYDQNMPYTYLTDLFLYKDRELLITFFDQKIDINRTFIVDGVATRFIEEAAYNIAGSQDIIHYIIDKFPDVDVDYVGTLPVFVHAFRNLYALDTLEKILKYSKKINDIVYVENGEKVMHYTLLSLVLSNKKYYKGIRDVSERQVYEYIIEVSKLLIQYGSDVNACFTINRAKGVRVVLVGEEEYTILEQAVLVDTYFHDIEITKLILESNADITITTRDFNTRIEHMLSLYDSFDDIEEQRIAFFELLKQYQGDNFDINCKMNTGATPLLMAAQHCQPNLVVWLIKNGADPFVIGGYNNTNIIDHAISTWPQHPIVNRKKTVKNLIESGVDIEIRNADDKTPLLIASEVGALDVVNYLLSQGANVDATTAQGENAICYAVTGAHDYQFTRTNKMNENNKIQIIKLLHQYGCNINCITKEGLTPLGYAIYYGYNEILVELLSLGANVNQKDAHGLTPLMRALEYQNDYAVNVLLKHPLTDLQSVDASGQNILFYIARGSDSIENTTLFLEMLQTRHVKLTKSILSETPLSYAVDGKYDLTNIIIDYYDNLNEEDTHGATPFFIAAGFYSESKEDYSFASQKPVLSLLLERGADINYVNRDGMTVLDIASRLEHSELKDYLLENGATSSKVKHYLN